MFCNIPIVIRFMGKCTAAAILNPIFQEYGIPSAFLSQRIQRAIAEQAVKLLLVNPLMTGKKFTFFILKKRKMLSFPVWFIHMIPPPKIVYRPANTSIIAFLFP